jgi:hypothetical protein
MQRYLIAFFFHCCLLANGQSYQSDWENYILSIDGKPVSINIDLGIGASAPLKERSFVVIVRTKISNPDSRGMPYNEEEKTLLKIEDTLVAELGNATGAVFVGRFTQRGIREFYFYSPDTVGYEFAVNNAMKGFSEVAWLSQAKKDPSWENYFTVLYPPQLELLKIKSRRQIDQLKKNDAGSIMNLAILHTIEFPDIKSREKFLRNLPFQGFEILYMPELADTRSAKYSLVIKRKEVIGPDWIEQFILPLSNAAKSNGGKYLEWTIESP